MRFLRRLLIALLVPGLLAPAGVAFEWCRCDESCASACAREPAPACCSGRQRSPAPEPGLPSLTTPGHVCNCCLDAAPSVPVPAVPPRHDAPDSDRIDALTPSKLELHGVRLVVPDARRDVTRLFASPLRKRSLPLLL